MQPSTTNMRHRTRGMVQHTKDSFYRYETPSQNFVQEQSLGKKVVLRKEQHMYDVVTPNYRERSAAGEIINSPMVSTSEELNFPLCPHSWSSRNSSQTGLCQPSVPGFKLKSSGSPLTDSYNAAITAAYANVSANEGNTLLWLGEMKETLSMLKDIGNGIRSLYEKTKKQRIKWAKGKMTITEAQSFTLQLLYGILPLEQQIADFMEGLFKTKPHGRHTARSLRVDQKTESYQQSGVIYGAIRDIRYLALVEEELVTTFRAGVYYEFDITDAPWLSVILEPKAVVSTTYALARLSFVTDWFINVGSTLKAWSPTSGVTELSAWITVETVHTMRAKYVPPVSYNKNDTAVIDSGDCTYVTKKKYRTPVDRSDLAILPRLNVNLNLDKIFAMVLLFAKIRKTM